MSDEMKTYRVIWQGTIRDVYYVEAKSEDEALLHWPGVTPDSSEATDGEVISVEVDDE